MQLHEPIISSYTIIASVFSTIEISQITKDWIFDNYLNLKWDEELQILSPGSFIYDNPYEVLINSPFYEIELIDTPEENVINELLADGYCLICPINTYKMKVTIDCEYVHDVLIGGLDDTQYCVYDFWRPKFVWSMKNVKSDLLLESIDFSNAKLFDRMIAFKLHEHEKYYERQCNINDKLAVYMQSECGNVGIGIYNRLIDYTESIVSKEVLPISNYQILYDHHILLKNLMDNYNLFIDDRLESIIDELCKESMGLRNYCMKIWYSRKEIPDWKQVIKNRIQYIRDNEKEFWHIAMNKIII